MSRLTTSKKKYEQNFENHRCNGSVNQNNRLAKHEYGHASLKVQKFDKKCPNCDFSVNMPLKSYTYSHRGGKCNCSDRFRNITMNGKCEFKSRDVFNKQSQCKCLCNGNGYRP